MLYCKLVRDNLPEIIKANEKRAFTYVLSDNEYEVFLDRKLDEEIREYHESKDIEELADILEVITSIAKLKGCDFADLINIKEQKSKSKGGFSKKIFLVAVSDN